MEAKGGGRPENGGRLVVSRGQKKIGDQKLEGGRKVWEVKKGWEAGEK